MKNPSLYHLPEPEDANSRIIAITPALHQRVLADRRREPRERMADLERRLAAIVELIVETDTSETCPELERLAQIYRIAKGQP